MLLLPLSVNAQSQCDVNGDGRVDVLDINIIAGYICGDIKDTTEQYVDLGLTSGVLWATCNVGATTPEGYGNYYAWGELKPKETYTESNYQYYVNGSYKPLYEDISHYFVDAARMNLGDEWRMPKKAEVEELLQSCTWTSATKNSINGYTVTGPSGKSIFIPCGGMYNSTGLQNCGTKLYYWTSTRSADLVSSAYVLSDDGYTTLWTTNRFYGLPIRPVRY